MFILSNITTRRARILCCRATYMNFLYTCAHFQSTITTQRNYCLDIIAESVVTNWDMNFNCSFTNMKSAIDFYNDLHPFSKSPFRDISLDNLKSRNEIFEWKKSRTNFLTVHFIGGLKNVSLRDTFLEIYKIFLAIL